MDIQLHSDVDHIETYSDRHYACLMHSVLSSIHKWLLALYNFVLCAQQPRLDTIKWYVLNKYNNQYTLARTFSGI